MSFKETWKPRVDGVDDADSSAVNEIAEAVINNEENIENIDEKTYSKQEANTLFANALKGSASGEVVSLKDVSPLAHNMAVKVRSKNGCDNIWESGGINSGTGLNYNTDMIRTVNYQPIKPNTAYTVTKVNFTAPLQFRFYDKDKNFIGYKITDVPEGTTVRSFTTEGNAFYVRFNIAGIREPNGELVQLEEGGTSTPYTPYVDVTKAKIKAMGKNHIDISKATAMAAFHEIADVIGESVIVSPKENTDRMYGITFQEGFDYTIGETYTLSAGDVTDHGIDWGWGVRYTDGTSNNESPNHSSGILSTSTTLTFVAEKEIKQIQFYIGRPYNTPQDIIIRNIQMELGSATEYEPYKAPVEYTVNADGTVDGVKSIAPATTLTTDTEGVLIEVEYNKDANKVVATLEQRLAALEAAIISQ